MLLLDALLRTPGNTSVVQNRGNTIAIVFCAPLKFPLDIRAFTFVLVSTRIAKGNIQGRDAWTTSVICGVTTVGI